MIDIFNLYQNFNSMYNTHQAGFFRPVRDFIPAVHAESLNIFNILGQRLQKNQATMDMLNPFIKSMNIAIIKMPAIEYAPTPPDYVYYSDSRILMEKEKICGQKDCDLLKNGDCIPFSEVDPGFFTDTSEFESIPVRLIMNSKWSDVTTHANRGPKMGTNSGNSRIYCTQTVVEKKMVFEILPKNIGVIVLHYYRLPQAPVFSYSERTNGPDVYMDYNQALSKQLEWGENMVPIFLHRLGKRYGLATRDELAIQVSQMDKDLL